MFFAHSIENSDGSDWEPLADHLVDVAARSSEYGRPLGLAPICNLAGLLHDLGKYNPEFQLRLRGATHKVDHSTAGAAVVRQFAGDGDQIFAELIGYAIAGHHAGLPDKRGVTGSSLAERIAAFDESRLDPVWRSEVKAGSAPLRPDKEWRKETLAFQLAMMGRMVFSALVDADFKATEAFYALGKDRQPDRTWPALADRLDGMIAALDTRLAELAESAGAVTRLRGEIVADVRRKAAGPPGLYTLTVPTGGGKTLTSLGFALDHARAHGKRRIIYAIPFTAIIDQTAIRVDDPALRFTVRSRRPPRDAINALLSLLYTLLTHDCRSALESVGLDPAVGFLHRDRPGRPSLALDLMEELRPIFADRLALSLINRRQLGPSDFEQRDGGAVWLADTGRKTVLTAWQERKKEERRHDFLGEPLPFGLVPYVQAQLLARHLRGDLDGYPPWVWK